MLHKSFLAIILAAVLSTPVMADDDYDDDNYRPRSSQAKNQTASKAVISAQQARNIALNRVGKKGRITDVDFDHHDDDHRGVATYDVDVVLGRTKHEVKINAHTGAIIRIKRDNND